ncbi:MAG: type II secretion system protein, partial [Oscillospiraceae bacterium]
MKTKPQIDNRGMTLVELLVAVVILGIIVVPLLHTIVTGATTERKSRVAGEATATAQDILETIEASDAELILTDAGTVATDAQYYIKSANGTFTAATTTAPKDTDVYYIGIKNIKNGSSTFDALVTLNASGGVYNEKEVTVSNPMDASINLMGADAIALAKFNALFQEHFDSPVAQNYIPREIEIDVTKPETDGSDFDITVNFNYTGRVSYTVKDKDDKDVTLTVPFADTETASARVSAPKPGEAPSVSLFCNAYGYPASA